MQQNSRDTRDDLKAGFSRMSDAIDRNTDAMGRLADSAPPKAMVYTLGAVAFLGILSLLAFTIALIGDIRGADVRDAAAAAATVTPQMPPTHNE